MIAVDTNVLVRAVVDDPDQSVQVEAARTRVRRTEARGSPFFGTGGCPAGSPIRGMARRGDDPSIGTGSPLKFLADRGMFSKTVAFLQTLGHDAVYEAFLRICRCRLPR